MAHSARWQVTSFALIALGAMTLTTPQFWPAVSLLSVGLCALGVTITRCARYALATDIEALGSIGRRSRHLSRATNRTRIAGLYFIQPLARAWGRLRGALSPPQVDHRPTNGRNAAPSLTLAALRRAWPRVSLRSTERHLWGERWVSAESLLTQLVEKLRQSRDIGTIEIDDGWRADRDIRIAVGLWAWLDLRTLVEDHGSGACLVRIAQQVRPGLLLMLTGLVLTVGLLGGVATVAPAHWPLLAGGGTALAVATTSQMLWRSAKVLIAVHAAIEDTSAAAGLLPMPDGSSPVRNDQRDPDMEHTHFLRPQDEPAIWLNEALMDQFTPPLEPHYFDASKYAPIPSSSASSTRQFATATDQEKAALKQITS